MSGGLVEPDELTGGTDGGTIVDPTRQPFAGPGSSGGAEDPSPATKTRKFIVTTGGTEIPASEATDAQLQRARESSSVKVVERQVPVEPDQSVEVTGGYQVPAYDLTSAEESQVQDSGSARLRNYDDQTLSAGDVLGTDSDSKADSGVFQPDAGVEPDVDPSGGSDQTGLPDVEAPNVQVPGLGDLPPVALLVLVFVGLWLLRPALEGAANATE